MTRTRRLHARLWPGRPGWLLAGPAAAGEVPFEALGPGTTLAARLALFRQAHPGEDGRALAALWTQWYLATALPPLVAAAVLLEAAPALEPRRTAMLFDRRGRPVGLRIGGHVGRVAAGAGLEHLARRHAGPLLEAVAEVSGLSPRVPWSNAAAVIAWTLEELAATSPARRLLPARRALTSSRWPDGTRNPLAATRAGVAPGGVGRRRTCCLRYRLRGFDYCADCPVTWAAAAHGGRRDSSHMK